MPGKMYNNCMSLSLQSIKNLIHGCLALGAVIYYHYPAAKLTTIGVTGTDGKTTTSTLIYHLLKSAGIKVALISTVAAYIGNERIDTGFHVTSPDSCSLQRLLARIVNQGYTHVVLESTSHGLDQHRLLGTNIQIAVVTNVTHEHLDYHKTYTNYIRAKAKIFSTAHTAIINADDASFKQLKRYIPNSCQLISYSLKQAYNLAAGFSQNESRKLLATAQKKFSETYNHQNTLAASIVVRVLGVPFDTLIRAIPTFPGVPGRMQIVPNNKGINAIVDFAHTPNALKAALTAARTQTQGKLLVVFGAAGLRDATKRPLMGEIASQLADEVILTSEDPRTEDARLIIEQIKTGATQNRGHIHSQPDRRQAIQFALSLASTGDTVIVCGKGHEQSMNLDGKREVPWSDAEVMSSLLRG